MLSRKQHPMVQGKIERRILLNYRIDPEVATAQIPAPYRPKLHRGKAIGGICLIRITNMRPRYAPPIIGLSSENAACRFAVEWEDAQGKRREGMYIPHRDTSSRISTLLGGTLLPGPYSHAYFVIYESFDELFVEMRAHAKVAPALVVQGHISTQLPHDSIFSSLDEAADFFSYHCGAKSEGATPQEFGIKLRPRDWQLIPVDITCMRSVYFDDKNRFPEGSIHFDSALLLRGTVTDWVRETWQSPAAAEAIPLG